jgi:hypothetical protein
MLVSQFDIGPGRSAIDTPPDFGEWWSMALKSKHDGDVYPEAESQRRFEALVKSALNTPPKPMKDRPKGGGESKARKAAKPSS